MMTTAPARGGRSPAPAVKPLAGKPPRNPVAASTKPEAEILFQTYFKSVGPRTYAAQLKKAGNGNHFLVLTEGRRDDKTGEVRKTRLFVFSEDFVPLFKMLHETAQFIRANPVPEAVKKKRDKFWAKKGGEDRNAAPRQASSTFVKPTGSSVAKPAGVAGRPQRTSPSRGR